MILTANILGSTGQSFGFMTVEVDADIATASDDNSLRVAGNDYGPGECVGVHHDDPWTPHLHRRVQTAGLGTVVFSARNLIVIPG